MWRPNEPVEKDGSNLGGIDPKGKRRRSRRRAWHDGLTDQTVVQVLEDVRSYRAFERTLVGSVDPRSVIELALVIGWQTCCGDFVAPARLKPACLRCRANFCPLAGRTRPAGPVNRRRCKLLPGPMGIAKALARTDVTIRRSATTTTRCQRPCGPRRVDGRSPTPSPNVSCAFPILIQPCLTARAATRRDCGAKPRKPSGVLRL
jgi:hypothetical protein